MFHVKHPQRHNQPQHKNLTVKPTQKDPQQANHQKAVTHQSLFSRWKNPFMPTDDKPEIIRHLSYFSLKFIQHPQTWLVSVGKEDQAR